MKEDYNFKFLLNIYKSRDWMLCVVQEMHENRFKYMSE